MKTLGVLLKNSVELTRRDLHTYVVELLDDQVLRHMGMVVLVLDEADKHGREVPSDHLKVFGELSGEAPTFRCLPYCQTIANIVRLESQSSDREIRIAPESTALGDTFFGLDNNGLMDLEFGRLGTLR